MMYEKEYQLWVESVKEEYLKEHLEKMTEIKKEDAFCFLSCQFKSDN